MTRHKLTSILRNIIQPENLTNLTAVVVAMVLGYRSIQTGTTDQYFQAVLAVLGVLALAQLVAGYSSTQRDLRIKQLAETVGILEQSMTAHVSAANFLAHRADFPSLEARFEGVKQIDAVGISLIGLSTTHHALLQRKQESGCRIRFIITNPSNKALSELIAQRFPESLSREMHISHVKTTLISLNHILGHHSSGGSMEVRLSDNFPPFGLLATDTDKPTGKIQVELYPDGCPIGQRPIFELCASRDGEWYSFFRQQFEILWQKAIEVKV